MDMPFAAPVNRFYQGSLPEGDYRFFQIAWVVDDLFETARKWVDVYGVGPFHIMPKRKSTVFYRGEEVELEMQLGVVQSGPVQLEFIQQTSDTPSVYRDIYPEGSGGVHHMCTVTHDYDGTLAHYASKGIACLAEVRGAMRVGYLDTFKDFGFITEVVEYTPAFIGHLEKIAKTCATWDGKDPIRLMTRDGYRVPE